MSVYKFTYDATEFRPRTTQELKPDFYSHAMRAEIVIDDMRGDGPGASIDSLVAALRQIMVAAGFSDRQSRQVVVIPHSKVEA
jgi:hypothetical protein